MTPATVVFDVGGTIYRVSKSLLDRFPDTMLARMTSETWCQVQATTTGESCTDGTNEKDSADSEKGTTVECSTKDHDRKDEDQPMFIERDRDRFQFVLDYMRDGKVMIPSNGRVTKESMIAEFQYYGFCDASQSAIEVNTCSPCESAEHLASLEKEHNSIIVKLDYEKACRKLAHYCFSEFRERSKFAMSLNFEVSLNFARGNIIHQLSQTDVAIVTHKFNGKDPTFQECLAFFGLKCLNMTVNSPNFMIKLAKLES